MFGKKKIYMNAYYSGVVDWLNSGRLDPGVPESAPKHWSDVHTQGYYDASAGQVLRPRAFDLETILRRSEIRKDKDRTWQR